MANIEKITYKGNVYDISDAKALHSDDIGPWMPDFDNMPVLETHEFDISGTSIYKVCERANVTSINDATDVVAYRCTVTGTNIRSVTDVIFRLTPTVNTAPNVTAYNRTLSTTAATTGLRYIYTVYPKAANTNYTYQSCVAMYNSTTRHVKIEVFKTNSNWTFVNARTTYSYNTTYQTRNELQIYTRLGYISNSTAYFNANTANSATYISSYAPLYNSSYSLLTAGAALSANTIAFVSSEDNKVYPIGNTTKAINTNWPLMWVSNAVSSGGAISYSYLRIFGTITPGSTVTKDTFSAGQTVYCRCTLSNGNVYSNNLLTPTITPGYAYVKFGIAYSASVVVENAYGAFYFYKDMYGNVSNLNGYPIGAERANSVAKNINASTGSYGVLIDDHVISTLNSTVVPSISNNLTFNPSTGILNATGFSGSGAGLTNIPSSAVSGMPTALSDLTDDMGVSMMRASDNVLFGTCSSAATAATKVITITNSSYEVKAGTRLLVWFSNVSGMPSSGNLVLSIDDVTYRVYIYEPDGGSAVSYLSRVAPYFRSKRFLNFYISGDNPQRAYILPDTDTYLKSPQQKEIRIATMNVQTSGGAYMQMYCATNACTTGKPSINGAETDATVIHLNWDNSDKYSNQIAVQSGNDTFHGMAYRSQNGSSGGWNPWKTLIDEDNISSYLPSTVELNTNKVISVDSTSTDTEYPSAKAVYDAIKGDDPIEDTDVFISRTSSFGENKYKSAKLVGGTVAFNQIAIAPYGQTVTGITFTRDSEKKTVTISGTATDTVYKQFNEVPPAIIGHVYYASLGNSSANSENVYLYNDGGGVSTKYASNGITIGKATLEKRFYIFIRSGTAFSSPVTLTPQIIDLTLMLGSAIADRIYAMETATAGAGVAWFKKYFPKDYYPYNTGTLVSVCPTGMASGDASYKVSPLELNGYPSIDSNDSLIYDGDIRESNGKVTRKWFITKLDGTESWNVYSTSSHTFYLNKSYFDAKNRPKTGYWQVNDTFAYGGWNTYITSSQIDTIDGIYTRYTGGLIVTVMSCSTLAEFQAYLAANPIFIGWRIEEFTESAYPFKSPQLVYSGEAESFIDDRDVPVPVGQIAEYMDNFDAVEDAALADAGNFELLSNKATTIDSTSTDDEYPSAKCVYDAISGISPGGGAGEGYYVGTCSTAGSTRIKVVTVSDSSFSLRNGVRISVEMANANTDNAPKLNVNDTGAKPILIAHIAKGDFTEISGAATLMPFSQAGIFDFRYYAAYNSNAGGWVLDYTPQAFALGGRYVNGSRGSSLDLANVTEGGLRYGLWASSATHAPFSAGVTAAISMFHDTAGAYTRQIAMSTGSFPKMAIRTQNNPTWGDWRYVLTAPTELSSTNNNLKPVSYQYTAQTSIDTSVLSIPINGNKYRLTQLQILNYDPDYTLGKSELYIFNAAGTGCYQLGQIKYGSVTSTASSISVAFANGTTEFTDSTNVQIVAYYAEIE